MLDTLIKKYKSWSVDSANIFHNHIVRGNADGEYIWETAPNGFFIYRSAGCYFCSNEGIIYSLSCWTNKDDWVSHLRFYEQVKDTECRIDVPIEYTELVIDGIPFFYRVFHRPNKEYGRDYHIDIFENKVDTQYFLNFIDDASIVIDKLKKFNEAGFNLPKLGITIFKRMFDSEGHFWIDFKYWELNFNEFIDITLKSLDTVIFYLEYNQLGVYNKELIIETAKEKWITT